MRSVALVAGLAIVLGLTACTPPSALDTNPQYIRMTRAEFDRVVLGRPFLVQGVLGGPDRLFEYRRNGKYTLSGLDGNGRPVLLREGNWRFEAGTVCTGRLSRSEPGDSCVTIFSSPLAAAPDVMNCNVRWVGERGSLDDGTVHRCRATVRR
ncbi:hypothetical protein [Inquilinus limosus]|uniref:hypothetical protein n=1 Tax=Inquilinus limosus TaxID=171674 RepID=UPI0012DEE159|nr:hypothetical protein [Inquilinus limosus]